MFSKKGQIIQVLLIIIVVALLLITYIYNIFQVQTIEIDDSELQLQQITNSFFHMRCFSDKYATIELDSFSQSSFSNCISEDGKILIRTRVIDFTDYLYRSDQEQTDFESRVSFCGSRSNIVCSKVSIPVSIVNLNGDLNHSLLEFEAIII